MKIQFPHDFSGEVSGRKCEGAFPEWEIPEEDMHIGGIEFSNIPQICDSCAYREACCMQVSQILLMGVPYSREDHIIFSKLFGMYFEHNEKIPKSPPTIDGVAHEIHPTKKLR